MRRHRAVDRKCHRPASVAVIEGVGVTVVKDAVAEWKRQRREVFVPPSNPAL